MYRVLNTFAASAPSALLPARAWLCSSTRVIYLSTPLPLVRFIDLRESPEMTWGLYLVAPPTSLDHVILFIIECLQPRLSIFRDQFYDYWQLISMTN